MKIKQITEAKYSGQTQEMYFMVEETGNTDAPLRIVGPFATKEQARQFEKQLEKHFGDIVVMGPTNVQGIESPESYFEDTRKEHAYWSSV